MNILGGCVETHTYQLIIRSQLLRISTKRTCVGKDDDTNNDDNPKHLIAIEGSLFRHLSNNKIIQFDLSSSPVFQLKYALLVYKAYKCLSKVKSYH